MTVSVNETNVINSKHQKASKKLNRYYQSLRRFSQAAAAKKKTTAHLMTQSKLLTSVFVIRLNVKVFSNCCNFKRPIRYHHHHLTSKSTVKGQLCDL